MSGRGLAGMVLRAVSLEQNSVGLGHPVGQMGRHGQFPAFGRHPRHGVGSSLPEGVPRRLIGGAVCVRTPDVGLENSYEPNGPFGAKSIGEVVINTPLPAISDAICNAIGTRFYELPITPEKIAMAVAEKEGAV